MRCPSPLTASRDRVIGRTANWRTAVDQQDQADRIDALLDEFENAVIEYREYQCGETGDRYDKARTAIADALVNV